MSNKFEELGVTSFQVSGEDKGRSHTISGLDIAGSATIRLCDSLGCHSNTFLIERNAHGRQRGGGQAFSYSSTHSKAVVQGVQQL